MNIIAKYLEQGVLLSPNVYDKVKDGKHIHLQRGELVVTDACLYKIIKPKERPHSIGDIVNMYSERFRFLSPLLADKLSPVSIDKLKDGKAQVVGIFREGELEDFTGTIALLSKTSILEGEVIGAIGHVRNNILLADEIVYPDVPLSNTPIFDKNNTIITIVSDTGASFPRVHCSPSIVEINGVVIQLSGFDVQSEKQAMGMLKRRHIDPISRNPSLESVYLMAKPPDILHVHSDTPFICNYKGATIIASRRGEEISVDLSTRERVQC